jgi:endonuclease/exonuclease/phosphatase family metal-dependent hydrolase
LRESNAAGGTRRRAGAVAVLAGLVAVAGLAVAPGAEAKKKDKSAQVTVMSRNLFLGADLGPALAANTFQEFTAANGAILREVDSTKFQTRAIGLAKEIEKAKPDLVGIQEGAWWRTNPTPGAPVQGDSPNYTATTNRYDFLQLLLTELNKNTTNKYKGYKIAVTGTEFDFEAPTDFDNDPSTGLFGGEIQARLTMRDAILVRKGGAVKVKNPQAGHYQNLYTPNISGIDVPVTRGWVSVDATATAGKGKDKVSKKFHFVDTHFEAFDDETQHPSIRALQAQELSEGSGPYGEGPASAKNTILVGDLNSNVPGVKPGDEQAYQVMLDNGFTERSTSKPLGCCVPSIFTGPASAFDHKVDHIMTNASKKAVKLVDSGVTGLEQANGLYDSDHAGLFSTLELK